MKLLFLGWVLTAAMFYLIGRDSERTRRGGTRDQRTRAVKAEARAADLESRATFDDQVVHLHIVRNAPIPITQARHNARAAHRLATLTGEHQ